MKISKAALNYIA